MVGFDRIPKLQTKSPASGPQNLCKFCPSLIDRRHGWCPKLVRQQRATGRSSIIKHQLTGNAGLYHVARELSRRGWHVMPTIRNARGSDLYAASDDESVVLRIQSKALSKKAPVPLGTSLDSLRSDWWIITVNANTPSPICFIMTLEEVKAGAHRGVNEAGKVSYWLQPKSYNLPTYQEVWDRLGSPITSPAPHQASATNPLINPTVAGPDGTDL
jgi:hypothetical protein